MLPPNILSCILSCPKNSFHSKCVFNSRWNWVNCKELGETLTIFISSFYIMHILSWEYKGAKGVKRIFVWVTELGKGAENKGRLRHVLTIDFPDVKLAAKIFLLTCVQLMLSFSLILQAVFPMNMWFHWAQIWFKN